MKYFSPNPHSFVLIQFLTLLLLAAFLSSCEKQGLRFVDVAKQANLEYSGPSYSAAVADVNGDGWLDIAFSQHNTAVLYTNEQGQFKSRVLLKGDIHGLTWLDWNNDHKPDLYISRGGNRGRKGGGANALFLNKQGILEPEKLTGAALNADGRGRSATPWDINNDGHLELFILNFNSKQGLISSIDPQKDLAVAAGWQEMAATNLTAVNLGGSSPPSFLVSSNRGNPILRFDRDQQLSDISQDIGVIISPRHGVSAVVPTDIDNDGDLDLYYVMTASVNQGVEQIGQRVYFKFTNKRNVIGGLSIKATGKIKIQLYAEGKASHQWGRWGNGDIISSYPTDINVDDSRLPIAPDSTVLNRSGVTFWRDNEDIIQLNFQPDKNQLEAITGWIEAVDGKISIYETHDIPKGASGRANHLFINENGKFVDRTQAFGVADPGAGMDALSADFDNDGDLDLYVLNSHNLFSNPPNVLYENNGNGHFKAVSEKANAVGSPLGRGASVVDFDYDRDGDLDLFISNGSGPLPGNTGPVQLLRNDSKSGNWLQIKLQTSRSNTMALGAKLTLETPGLTQTRVVTAATGRFSVSWRPIHFGMAKASSGTLSIDWPGGAQTVQSIKANQFITVVEPE